MRIYAWDWNHADLLSIALEVNHSDFLWSGPDYDAELVDDLCHRSFFRLVVKLFCISFEVARFIK